MSLFRDPFILFLIYVCHGQVESCCLHTGNSVTPSMVLCALPASGNYPRRLNKMGNGTPRLGPRFSFGRIRAPSGISRGSRSDCTGGAFQSTSTPTSVRPALWRPLLFGQESPGLRFESQHFLASRQLGGVVAAIFVWTCPFVLSSPFFVSLFIDFVRVITEQLIKSVSA
ncbi:hypothetical protein EDB83DRAFT_1599597 [Lactarius deliciosus]|nr:hypothetical protein EDB83DRAFT_1599597 [Lactarius deliciosus]